MKPTQPNPNPHSEPPATDSSPGLAAPATLRGSLAVPLFMERRIEGADNARIRPLAGACMSMPSERGGNPPAASDLDADPPLLTPAQAAAPLCVSPRTIKRELAKLPAWALRFGHQWRIDSAALLAAGRRAARKI